MAHLWHLERLSLLEDGLHQIGLVHLIDSRGFLIVDLTFKLHDLCLKTAVALAALSWNEQPVLKLNSVPRRQLRHWHIVILDINYCLAQRSLRARVLKGVVSLR